MDDAVVIGARCAGASVATLLGRKDYKVLLLARYASGYGNFVLVVSGSFEANSTKKLIEIVYNLLIEAIQLSSLVLQ